MIARAIIILAMVAMAATDQRCPAAEDLDPAVSPPTEQSDVDELPALKDVPSRRQFPVAIPPAEEVLKALKERSKKRHPGAEAKAQPEPTQYDKLMKMRGPLEIPPARCRRATPTKQEFLNLLRTNPADANQILRQCNIDVRSISPLPQLPVGRRQLPEDTRQRPVGTWGR